MQQYSWPLLGKGHELTFAVALLKKWNQKFSSRHSMDNQRSRVNDKLKVTVKHSFWSLFVNGKLCTRKDWKLAACIQLQNDTAIIQCHINIIGSAEALPILCVRCVRWERERYRERERERRKWRHLSSAEIGDEFCTFPCQKIAPWYWRRILQFCYQTAVVP